MRRINRIMFLPLEPWIFMISFSIGILLAYISTPPPKVIIRFPTLENAGKVIYKDDVGVCYRYRPVNVDCPKDPKKIYEPPLQVIDESEINQTSSGIFLMKRLGAWWNDVEDKKSMKDVRTNESDSKRI